MDAQKPYLASLKMNSFGAFANRALGPFSPNLTILKGKNEAGKSTTTSFISQVLYGWEAARAGTAHYRPGEKGKRSGWIEFASSEGEWRLLREEGVKEPAVIADAGNPWPNAFEELTAGVDKATYANVFSLNADQLKQLENTGEITSKLLTAGSATSTSPVAALSQITEDVDTYEKRRQGDTNSVKLQKERLAELADAKTALEAEIRSEREEWESLIKDEAELKDIQKESAALSSQRRKIDEAIAAGNNGVEQLEKEELHCAELKQKKDTLDAQIGATKLNKQLLEAGDRISGLARSAQSHSENLTEVEKLNIQCAQLQEELNDSTRSIEAQEEDSPENKTNIPLLIVGIVLLLAGIGLMVVPGFLALPNWPSWAALVGAAIALIGAVVGMYSRRAATVQAEDASPTQEEELAKAKKQATLEERKSLLATLQAQCVRWEEDVRTALTPFGTEESASGSELVESLLRLEFEYKEARKTEDNKKALKQKYRETASMHQRSVEEAARLKQQIQEKNISSEDESSVEAIREQLEKLEQQKRLIEIKETELNEKFGALSQEVGGKRNALDMTRKNEELQELDFEYEQEAAVLTVLAQEYLECKLAQRLLQQTLVSWEEDKQPTIYSRASELFERMTLGRWKEVRPGEKEGELLAVKHDREQLPVEHLSTSTMQILYLALRLALLESAENTGASLPVIVDDAFIHFDEDRNKEVARVISELAYKRQVLLFTFDHKVIELFKACNEHVHTVSLG